VTLVLRVRDGAAQARRATRLVVYQPEGPLTTPSRWRPGLPPIPWRAWLEQGFGFLVLLLVHSVGMNAVAALQRWSLQARAAAAGPEAEAEAEAEARRSAAASPPIGRSSACPPSPRRPPWPSWLWRQRGA
jgi:hypothetical protein